MKRLFVISILAMALQRRSYANVLRVLLPNVILTSEKLLLQSLLNFRRANLAQRRGATDSYVMIRIATA